MTRLLRPKVVMPILLSAALLAALLAVGNVGQVVALMLTFRHSYLPYILVLLLAYEVVQCLQWHVFLKALGIHVPLRSQAFAYLVGEPTRVLPIGNFFENYFLLRARGTDFGLSSAATILSVLTEVGVALLGLVILGLDHWGWLRPLIIIGLAVFVPSAWLVYKHHHAGTLPSWLTLHQSVRTALDEARQLRRGAAALLHPGVVARGGLLGALYLVLAASVLYLVLRGLGVDSVSWWQVLAVYLFSLAFALIFPLPVDVGVTELGGVGAFLAIGVLRSQAVSAVLLARVLSLGAAIVIALVTMAVMRDEVRALLGSRARPATPSPVAELAGGVQAAGVPGFFDEDAEGARAQE
jgi:uncharacterized membrane protein YbhN (UPF0104 family)